MFGLEATQPKRPFPLGRRATECAQQFFFLSPSVLSRASFRRAQEGARGRGQPMPKHRTYSSARTHLATLTLMVISRWNRANYISGKLRPSHLPPPPAPGRASTRNGPCHLGAPGRTTGRIVPPDVAHTRQAHAQIRGGKTGKFWEPDPDPV